MTRLATVLPAAAACLALLSCERPAAGPDEAEAAADRTPVPGRDTAPAGWSRIGRVAAPVASAAPAEGPTPKPSPSPAPVRDEITLKVPLRPELAAAGDRPGPAEGRGPSPSPVAPAPPTASQPTGAATPRAAAIPASFPPRNECQALPGYPQFRARLVAAVRNRDADALAALADPDVKLDFGGGSGRDELRRRLSGRAGLWGELGEILALGCARDGDLATMPWVFSRMPDAVDPYRAMLVMGDRVPLRESAGIDAPTVTELTWALVVPTAGAPDGKARFVAVETTGGRWRGFVEARLLRSLLDYRMIAEPQGEGWAITALVAGD